MVLTKCVAKTMAKKEIACFSMGDFFELGWSVGGKKEPFFLCVCVCFLMSMAFHPDMNILAINKMFTH